MKYKTIITQSYPLKAEIEKRRVSQSSLAKKIGISTTYLNAIINGHRTVSKEFADTIIKEVMKYNV